MFGDYLKAIDILDLMVRDYDQKYRTSQGAIAYVHKASALREAIKQLRSAWQSEQLKHEEDCRQKGLLIESKETH